MIRFRHKGCQSEVVRYVGQAPLEEGSAIHCAEWQLPDCRHPQLYSPLPRCPDCGERIRPTPRLLEPIPEEETATET